MLPVYKAISFIGVLEKGGRTKPWLVFVETETGIKPYVVKIFDTLLIEEKDSVTNEVLGNIIAKEFELPVPKAAFIDIGQDFVYTLRDFDLIDLLSSKDDRMKFGTEYLEGYNQFNSELFSISESKEIISIDSVFAFDNLIRNPDRGNSKNLLVKSEGAYLIDHELGFELRENIIKDLQNWQWDERFYRHHIFYSYLRNSFQRYKDEYFYLFEEYLKRFNINILDEYFVQLKYYGFSEKKHQSIRDYIAQMKLNSHNFVYILRHLINQ